jgi:transposase
VIAERLSAAQLAMLVEGLNWKQAIVHDEVITPRLA